MSDDNNLNSQRRNLIIISMIILVYSITANSIDKFQILGVEFIINQEFDLNLALILIWVYFLFRYISTVAFKIRTEKIIEKEQKQINQIVIAFSSNKINVQRVMLFLEKIVYLLFNKIFFDYYLPVLFAFLSMGFLLNNKLTVLQSFDIVIAFIVLLYLGVFVRIALSPKVKKQYAKDYYVNKGKSKLRQENFNLKKGF